MRSAGSTTTCRSESGTPVANQAQAGGKYVGRPALVDEETADRILDLDVSDLPKELLVRVNDSAVLTEKEIEDAMHRLKGVQRHLRALKANGDLVRRWDDATYQQALQDPTTSYLKRQVADLENALQRSANDPMYEVLDAPQPQATPPPPIASATTTPPTLEPPLNMPGHAAAAAAAAAAVAAADSAGFALASG